MPRHVLLLRGVNLVRRNRVSMPELRSALREEGFGDVATYLQSGNVVLSSEHPAEHVARDVRELMKTRFGLDLVVLARSHAELAQVLHHNPLGVMADNPRRYLVTFLARPLPAEVVAGLEALPGRQEPFAVIGREVYSWHPEGIGRTPLWERLADRRLGVEATSRNWTTVTALAAMADESTSR